MGLVGEKCALVQFQCDTVSFKKAEDKYSVIDLFLLCSREDHYVVKVRRAY